MMPIKICGLTRTEHVEHCLALGVEFLGCVAYEKSPRHVDPTTFKQLTQPLFKPSPLEGEGWVGGKPQVLTTLVGQSPPPAPSLKGRGIPVLVTVDADDALLDAYSPSGLLIQCHGSESPARLREIRQRYGCGIIKAITDPAQAVHYADSADYLLIDATPAAGELPGGNARKADWEALRGFSPPLPWFLSGGLTVQNVGEALRITGAKMLDVSSGVERERGVKDLQLIEEFVNAAHNPA